MQKPDDVTSEVCIFCKIVSGELGGTILYRDDECMAFLDVKPLFHGHTLLVPREHHETLLDLPEERIGHLFSTAKMLARAVQEAMDAAGTFVAMNNKVSQSVPHLHVHIVPRRPKDGLRGFFWPRTSYDDQEQMETVGAKIRELAK